MQTDKPSKRKSRGDDYVNNADFSEAVTEYVVNAKKSKKDGGPLPVVTNYIAECFIKICNGLSRAPSFMSYSYREDMVMDAVENCLKAITNYDVHKPTRTGKPNPFSYFTQISYFAFLRRIEKEKKQMKIKQSLIASGGIDTFAEFDENSEMHELVGESLVEKMRQKNDAFYKVEHELAPIFEISKPARLANKKFAATQPAKKENPLDILFED